MCKWLKLEISTIIRSRLLPNIEEEGPGTWYCMHMRRGPQKKNGDSDIIIHLSVCHPYSCMYTGNLGQVTTKIGN